jgi:hypothetical protein
MPHRLIASFVALAIASGALVATPTESVSSLAPPSRRVVMVSDSVGLGAAGALPAAFGPGWDVRVIGTPALFVEQLLSKHIQPQLAANRAWFGDHVVVAGGYNYPYWDPARFDRSIDAMVNALTAAGVKHVYWVTLREVKPQYVSPSAWRQVQPYYWYFPAVNDHLERALERHPALTLVDWAANADQAGITYDAIHLNRPGAALYSELIRQQVTNANTRSPNAGITRLKVGDADTKAVAINITTTGTRRGGFLAAYPCDRPRPEVSNVNHGRDQTIAGAAIVPVGSTGEICVYNHQAAQVIVDLFGRFDRTSGLADGATPTRLLDTRSSGRRQPALRTRAVRVTSSPGSVGGVVLNVTAVGADRRGHVSVHDCGSPKPATSNVNFGPVAATPNLVIAAPDGDGDVCLTATADTHLLVDRFGEFASGGSATPVPPERVVDTRRDPTPPKAGQVVRFSIASYGLLVTALLPGGAVVGNLTVANATERGFATVWPCAEKRPATSNVNYSPGRNVANLFVVRPDLGGELCVYTSRAVEVIVDVQGAVRTGFTGIVAKRLVDTRAR